MSVKEHDLLLEQSEWGKSHYSPKMEAEVNNG